MHQSVMSKHPFAKEKEYIQSRVSHAVPIFIYLFHQVWTFEVESFTEVF